MACGHLLKIRLYEQIAWEKGRELDLSSKTGSDLWNIDYQPQLFREPGGS
jgi:hypothetical protein